MCRWIVCPAVLLIGLGGCAPSESPAPPPPPPAASPAPSNQPPITLEPPEQPDVRAFNESVNWMLRSDLHYVMGKTNDTIVVPKGFVTDFASIPREFYQILLPTGRHARAAVVHDYLYWTHLCTRAQSDNVFWIAMTESRVDHIQAMAMYLGVHKGGNSAWLANDRERSAGKLRILLPPYDNPPPNDEWAAYRAMLYNKGVRGDTSHVQQHPAFCTRGDKREVPGS